MKYHVQVWEPVVQIWQPLRFRISWMFSRPQLLHSSTYQVESADELWELCEWATKKKFQVHVIEIIKEDKETEK